MISIQPRGWSDDSGDQRVSEKCRIKPERPRVSVSKRSERTASLCLLGFNDGRSVLTRENTTRIKSGSLHMIQKEQYNGRGTAASASGFNGPEPPRSNITNLPRNRRHPTCGDLGSRLRHQGPGRQG